MAGATGSNGSGSPNCINYNAAAGGPAGSVNSTYSLYKFLSETDHEIIAIHFTEEYYNVDERQDFITVSDWLIENVRSFERHYVRLPKVKPDMRPIRAGFKNMCSYSELYSRYTEFLTQSKKHTVDALAFGYSVENTSTDRTLLMMYNTWQSEEGVKVFLPSISITEDISFENGIDILAAQMSGRFEQREKIPSELTQFLLSMVVMENGVQRQILKLISTEDSLIIRHLNYWALIQVTQIMTSKLV